MFCIYVTWSRERITKLKIKIKMFWKTDEVEKSNGDVEMIVVNPPMNTLLPIDFMQPLISTLLKLLSSNEAMTMCSYKVNQQSKGHDDCNKRNWIDKKVFRFTRNMVRFKEQVRIEEFESLLTIPLYQT